MAVTINASTTAGLVNSADTSGILQLQTANTTALTIDASQNVGVGTTPAAWALSNSSALQIKNAGFAGYLNNAYVTANQYFTSAGGSNYIANGFASMYIQQSGQHQFFSAASGTAGAAASMTQAMTLDASGNLALGKTSTSYRLGLQVANSASNVSAFEATNATNASFEVFLRTDVTTVNAGGAGNLAFATGGSVTERARIDSSGNLLVGTTSSSLTSNTGFKVIPGNDSYIGVVTAQSTNANSGIHLYSTGAGAYRFYVGNGGTVYATSTTISAISDIRFKENVRDLNVGLAEVMALKPRLYDWKEGKGADIKNARGFIAQEFEEVFPDLIDEWKDPAPEGEDPYKSVRQDLIPVLVKAIQEQQALITQLQADVAALKGAQA